MESGALIAAPGVRNAFAMLEKLRKVLFPPGRANCSRQREEAIKNAPHWTDIALRAKSASCLCCLPLETQMFGLFKPKCPLDIREKVWTEKRLLWLSQRFGPKPMMNAPIVLPTSEFFPGQYTATADDVVSTFERVCEFLNVDASQFQMPDKIAAAATSGSSCCGGGCHSGTPTETTAEPTLIDLSGEDVADQERLIATLSRQVTRFMLLNHAEITGGEDFDSLTDLLAVYLGLGIFQANTAVKSQAWNTQGWEYWSIRGAGFLQARVPGYAMALMAWVRNEPNPAWASMLGTDAASSFHSGYKFATKTNDCLFRPDTIGRAEETRSLSTVKDMLANGSATRKLDAMWWMMENPASAAGAVEAMAGCFRHGDQMMVAEACRVAAGLGTTAEPVLQYVIECLSAQSYETRFWSATAIGEIKPPLDACPDGLPVSEELAPLLSDHRAEVVDAAMRTLARYGNEATPLFVGVVPRLVRYARDCEFSLLRSCVANMIDVLDDPREFLGEQMENTEFEIRERVLQEVESVLEERRTESA